MARNLVAAVGTGVENGKLIGRKSTFNFGEKIWALHEWDKLNGNELFKIVWQRKVNGRWKTEETHTWRNQGYEAAYQWAWIKNYPAGDWRIQCYVDNIGPHGVYFKVIGKEPSAPKPPAEIPEETASFWQDKGYSKDEAEAIAAWVRENKKIPSPDKINEIISLLKPFITPPLPEETIDFWIKQGYKEDEAKKIAIWVKENKQTPSPETIDEVIIGVSFVDKIRESVTDAIKSFINLSNKAKNALLLSLLLKKGEGELEKLANKLGDEFVEEYPEYKILKGAPSGSLSILAILGLIGGIVGFGTLVNWLRKELPEPSGMAVWAALEAEDWELANEANKKYRKFIQLANSWWMDKLGWLNPLVKSFFDKNRDSQLASADAYQKIIDEKLKEIEEIPEEEIELGTLKLIVEPADAKIEIAGKPEITKPGIYDIEPGSYTIKASKEGYYSKSATAIIKKNVVTTISITLNEIPVRPPEEEVPEKPPEKPKPKKATITITSEPTNAEVYINGKFTWTTTPYTTLLEPGTYIIRVQKDGYYPYEITAEIEEGETAEIPFTLERIPLEEKPVPPYIPQKEYLPEFRYIPPEEPKIIFIPKEQLPKPEYNKLHPEIVVPPSFEPPAPVGDKEILINVETTDVKPWKGRIYSIAYLDLSIPGLEPVVLVSDNEEELISNFLRIFEEGSYKKIVGYNVSFDYRYIFTKMMLYRMQSKAFYDADLIDVMQIMEQVKEEFVYGFNKPGTLDEWGKALLGKGKYGSQELMLKKYIQGDFDYVTAFQKRQIELTNGLYQLARFCASESLISPILSTPAEVSSPLTHHSPEIPIQTSEIQCPYCLAYNPQNTNQCVICGKPLKGG